MRKTILTEGVTEHHYHFKKGAVQPLAIDKIPVTYSFRWETADDIIGWATDMQRDQETGEISVDIQFCDPEKEFPEDFHPTVYCNQVEGDRSTEPWMIDSAHLRGVVLLPNSYGFPKGM